jgi:ribonuclease HII
MPVVEPTDLVERELFAAGSTLVIGVDEVGRGAIAGPVAVGMSVMSASCGAHPVGVRDSKLLSEKKRVELAPLLREWSVASAVGLASPQEIDELGIVHCLGLAAKRALGSLHVAGIPVATSTILLDGNSDWLNPILSSPLDVRTRVKADRDCVSVAAASVIAKVHRDELMVAAHEARPDFGWAGNKGYGSTQHMEAVRALGPSDFHRRTWLVSYA